MFHLRTICLIFLLTDVIVRGRSRTAHAHPVHLIDDDPVDHLPPPRDNQEVTQSIGENLLDALCIKYSSQPSGLIIYDDRLKANIIGEFSVDEFQKIHQSRDPVVEGGVADL